MKTSIKSIITFAVVTAILSAASLSVKADDNNRVTVLSEVKKVSKINVSGNVEVILVQSANEGVKVYDNYYAKNALVQQKDGELRISSFNKETLTIVVYASNVNSLTASDNVKIKTLGKFSTLTLDVNLSDNATADLNTNTVNLFTNVTGQSNLTLSGSTEEYEAVMGSVAKVNMDQFVAATTSIQTRNPAVLAKIVTVNELPDSE